ncbi:MAG TPA: hypothetical protein VME70_02770 [Mycobacteriales bacterium]|nr:hypothetical protein [Mycobacteriales bacterium]
MAYGNGDVWMIGDFTALRPPGTASGTDERPADYFAALKASTGAPDPAIDDTHVFSGQSSGLPLTNGAVAVSPDGSTVYVGGSFTSVDGQPRDHLAAFSTSTGVLLPWNPDVGGKVSAIAARGDVVYIGGSFARVGGVAVGSNFAALDATSGAPLSWGTGTPPSFDDTVDALAVNSDGSQVVVGGYFSHVDGLAQSPDGTTIYNKAAIIGGVTSTTPGALEPMPADAAAVPPGIDTDRVNGCSSDVKDIVLDSGIAYLADEGTGIGCFDGTWAVRLRNGSLKWVNRCLGATQAIEVVGDYLYKGSHAHDCASKNTNGDPANFPQLPHHAVRHLLSESLSNGFLGPWYPNTNAGPNLGPRAMATDGSQLYVGGDFTTVNGKAQQGIARFTDTNDSATPRPLPPSVTSVQTGVVAVTALAPVDRDDPDLVMELFRKGGSSPIASKAVESLFWRQPVVRWTLTGQSPGSRPIFEVRAVERYGSYASPLSSPATVRVDCGRPSFVRAGIVSIGVERDRHHSRHVRVRVCAARAMRISFDVTRGHHVLARRRARMVRAGNHTVTLAIKRRVSKGHARARIEFFRAAHHRVVHRSVYLPKR